MRTFELKRGTDTLTLDDAGKVTRGGADVGKWSTNAASQIVITESGGTVTPIDVRWTFDDNNHLLIEQGGASVFDINGDKTSKPSFRLDRAVFFIKPVDTGTFEFSIRPTWDLTATHDLKMTVNGVASTIDGVINDRNSAFRFRFVDQLEVIETFSLLFKGTWKNALDPARPAAVIYEYEIFGSAQPGVFTLPNPLVVDNNTLVLAYSYDKDGRTQSTQLVGTFSFNNFELNYVVERKNAAEGTSTTLKFDVDVKGASSEGTVTFALKRTDTGAVTTTELALKGNYTARFKNGVLTIGVQFSQRTITGLAATRELMFSGSLVNPSGAQIVWELKAANGSTSIRIAADHIRLGAANISGGLNMTMSNGQTNSVQALFGVSF